jgi:hypothetical protein
MSIRSISWGEKADGARLKTVPPSCAVVMKFGNLNFLEPSRPLQVFTFYMWRKVPVSRAFARPR